MVDQAVRSLSYLEHSASSARVLNLLHIHRRRKGEADYRANPFFKNPVLNRAIILKHRLRRDERELFSDGRRTATKIILPIDGKDLKVGARSVFVGQANYDLILEGVFGPIWSDQPADRELLEIIDDLPSLDPFLLREQLRRHDRNPARCYFEISNADIARMHKFVEQQIQQLVDLSSGGASKGADDRSGSRLASKILSDSVDAETEPLRLTLRLEKQEYKEGVFCWKGFLYYKWMLEETLPSVSEVAVAIAQAKPRGPSDAESRAALEKTREALQRSIMTTLDAASVSLQHYDAAFESLIGGNPKAFRDFLLNAPSMFCDLGERLGAITHIASFWKFRFPKGQLAPTITAVELMDIFSDFENSLSFPEAGPRVRPNAEQMASSLAERFKGGGGARRQGA
jgi:hypothetical protein